MQFHISQWRSSRRLYVETWRDIRRAILERDNFLCQICGLGGKSSDIILEIDHILPKSQGGGHEPENLRTLCRNCHIRRHGNTPRTPGTFSDRRRRKRNKGGQ